MSDKAAENKVSFKDTLNLPQTDFPIRAQAAIDDPAMLERWDKEELYEKTFSHNDGKEKYILHDGPPYANGNIHLGHAYNKILKDIIGKAHRMMGKHVPITPGWDCHGLPIELKVSQQFPDANSVELKKECRKYAAGWIDVQREEFKQLGVLMNWDHPYLSMNPEYEAETVRAFGKFVESGYIERKNKTVPWCASCQTVLASAEIEHQDRKDPSIYVLFKLPEEDAKKLFPDVTGDVSFLVWTTTPWTLPLNRALVIKPKADYELLDINGKQVIVGQALSDTICAKTKVEKKVLGSCKAEDFVGIKAAHPFIEGQVSPVITDHFVGLTDGTAIVHSAPGCGPEDYEIGLKNGLEVYSPLTVDGKYSDEIVPAELAGIEVAKAHGWVIKTLFAHDTLLHKESISHSYPHCWRCRNGLMFRATKQWFCDLSHDGLKEKALAEIETIKFIPERTRNHLKASVGGRLEWCLSRQRVWGTPIVAFLCNECDHSFVDQDVLEKVAQGISTQGIEYWDTVTIQELLGDNASCEKCSSKNLRKEDNILDVWFDSGVSHAAVLKVNRDLQVPADLYLEGVDQHRGWFQSSLLTSLVLNGHASTKAVATHGYTVDAKGRKMSKSLGNVVAPSEIIKELGTDGLRLWTSSIDLESDVVVSKALVTNIKEVFRKVRNTCRFLDSNLYDFAIENDSVPSDKMRAIDKVALKELEKFNKNVQQAYSDYDLTAVYHLFTDYCTTQLSSFYLDIVKDRLYTDQADGIARRSAQTACWKILDCLTKLMAPILSITAEQLSDSYQKGKTESIHLQDFPDSLSFWSGAIESTPNSEEKWEALRTVRSMVLKAIEKLRQEGRIKHSLEAKIKLVMKPSTSEDTVNTAAIVQGLFEEIEKETGQSKTDFFKEYCIISACEIVDEEEDVDTDEEGYELLDECIDAETGLLVKAGHADGFKCPRCWQWEVTDSEHGLCNRCQGVIAKQ